MVKKDAGNCFYCEKPVYISEGQFIKYKVVKYGETKEEYPTHKACRKIKSVKS